MTSFYATLDSDGLHIARNANIVAFETRQAAVDYLKRSYGSDSLTVKAGHFGDAWIIVHSEPRLTERYFKPFNHDDLIIRGPGQHPGGRAWWIEPSSEILVVESINDAE